MTTTAGDGSAGLLDTSVVVDLAALLVDPTSRLPERSDISAITLAELSAGPLLGTDAAEQARRLHVLQRTQAAFDPLPFDDGCAAAYARVVARTRAAGRSHRSRMADLLVAATSLAHGLPLYTRNPGDVSHLVPAVEVVGV